MFTHSSSIRLSANVLMVRRVSAYSYVGPTKDLVMGLADHDQNFDFRVGMMEIIGPYSIKKQAWAELYQAVPSSEKMTPG